MNTGFYGTEQQATIFSRFPQTKHAIINLNKAVWQILASCSLINLRDAS